MSHSPKSVLDIGCSEGWLIRELASQVPHLVGVDVVPDLIEKAEIAGGGRFLVASYEDIAAGVVEGPYFRHQLLTIRYSCGRLRVALNKSLKLHEKLPRRYTRALFFKGDAKLKYGYIGVVLGSIALLLALVSFWAGPFFATANS